MNPFFQTHRAWLTLLGGAILLLLVEPPLAGWGLDRAQSRAASIAAERAELVQNTQRFQEDMRLAEQMDGRMSTEDIDRLLAPAERLKIVAGLERQAASARFTHFTYTLAPEQKDKTGIGMEGLTQSDLTLAADMPMDTDAYAFLDHLRILLPGRVHIKQMVLTRMDGETSLDKTHMEAVLQWLSNSAEGGG